MPTSNGKLPLANSPPARPDRIVLVFQGGGALGAYQAGVYQALHEAGIEPSWIIGTSIGAFNAALIAGNEVDNRVPALREFWRRLTCTPLYEGSALSPAVNAQISLWRTLWTGIPNFFTPNGPAFCGLQMPLGVEQAAYYSTAPLKRTLSELIDIALIKRGRPRLTVGAAHVKTSQMHYFDNRKIEISLEHILASGALPPAFPAVRIDNELYWDGGILSNTPTEVVFDDNPRRNSLVFNVHIWQPFGPEPETIWDVMHRQKDIQYSSRMASHINRLQEVHRLRHIISELAARLPKAGRDSEEVLEMAAEGCLTRMHIVQLLAPRLEHEDQNKDVDFTRHSIEARWEAGHADACRAIELAPWKGEFQSLDGVILHDLPNAPATAQIGRPVMEEAGSGDRRDLPPYSKAHGEAEAGVRSTRAAGKTRRESKIGGSDAF
jgi:NTE family protein